MSRKIPEQQYEKTISYRFRQWLDGTKDPFLGTVEMKPQKEFHEDDTAVEKRKEEKKEIIETLIEGTYGISNDAMKARRARTLLSWYKWFDEQEFYIEEKYNE